MEELGNRLAVAAPPAGKYPVPYFRRVLKLGDKSAVCNVAAEQHCIRLFRVTVSKGLLEEYIAMSVLVVRGQQMHVGKDADPEARCVLVAFPDRATGSDRKSG